MKCVYYLGTAIAFCDFSSVTQGGALMPVSPSPTPHHNQRTAEEILAEIETAIGQGNITQAEELRKALLATYPMALVEVIKSAELIENEKLARIDKDHLATWDTLYASLSNEEKNNLYYNLIQVVIPPGKVILAQGGFNTRLFFIDSGKVLIYLPRGDKQTVIAELGKGDILGEYTFTIISLCSATAVSNSEVHLRYLASAAADSWELDSPGLYSKLIDFCIRKGRVDEIIRRKRLEKRTNERYPVAGQAAATLLTQDGKKTETNFRGALTDLSVTGACFMVKISKKSTARALLARHIVLSFSFSGEDSGLNFSAVGKITGVSFHLYNDYSIHVRFVKQLQNEQVQRIVLANT
jgi:CRP-like cAMP-binding protein